LRILGVSCAASSLVNAGLNWFLLSHDRSIDLNFIRLSKLRLLFLLFFWSSTELLRGGTFSNSGGLAIFFRLDEWRYCVLDGTGNNTGIAWSLAPFFFFDFQILLAWELGDKRDTRRGISVHERNTRERSLHGLIDMKVCVAFCFFFSARSGGTNTFYLITPRSQELCERDWVADEGWDCIAGGWMLLSG
jgi:hypothetical protein